MKKKEAIKVAPSENVATKQNLFLRDDESGIMEDNINKADFPRKCVEIQNVTSEEMLCRKDNPEFYKDCNDYNSDFCRQECSFGPQKQMFMKNDVFDTEQGVVLTKMDDVNLDYSREDGK